MSYTDKLTETQSENLDVRLFEIMKKFGSRNLETMQWTIDNHKVFAMARALLNSEEEAIVRFSELPTVKDHVFVPKELVDRLAKYRYCMSYNDSYFSEPHGELKRITAEFERAVTRSHDRAAEQRDPTSGETLLTPVVLAKTQMADRGIPFGQFKDMFPKFLASYDGVPIMLPKISEEPNDGWNTGVPPTLDNDFDYYIVAVRRGHDPESAWVFPAAYANNYNGDLRDQDGNEFVANGWFDVGPDRDADPLFVPTLDNGDEVVAWQPMPKYLR